MKILVSLLFCFSCALTFAQKKYFEDFEISIQGEPGNFRTIYYQNGKERVLASNIKVDEIVTSPVHGLLGFRKGSRYGFINIYGKTVVPAQFDPHDGEAYPLPLTWSGLYWIVRKGEQTALVDSTGAYAVPLGNYDALWDGNMGVCVAQKDEKIGLFRNGKMILPIEYTGDGYSPFEFTQEIMLIQKDTLVGLINPYGKFIVPVAYDFIRTSTDSLYMVTQNDGQGVLDRNGKTILPCTFDEVYDVIDGFVYAKKNGLCGIQKLDGTVIAPFEHEMMTVKPLEGAVFLKKGGLWGYFSTQHPKQPEFLYTNFYDPFWNKFGLAGLKKGDYWGFINAKNEVVTDFLYEGADYGPNFYNQHAVVMRNGKFGILNPKGKLVVPCELDFLDNYQYFPTNLRKNGKWGRIEENGTELIPFLYDSIVYALRDYAFTVMQNGKYGLYELGEKLLIPANYDEITLNSPYYEVVKNGKHGFFDVNGTEVLPCVLDEVLSHPDEVVLGTQNGILKKFSLETGKEEPLAPDSVLTFEKTSFIIYNNSYDWYCIDKSTNRLIGRPYNYLGVFDGTGRAAAHVKGADYDIAINSNGEELKPKYHLVNELIFETMVQDTIRDTIINRFAQQGLLNNDSITDNWRYINDVYTVLTEPGFWYDEYGNEVFTYFMKVYLKSSYYSFTTPFPVNPEFEFNFYNYYSRVSTPNEKGWRWALPKDYYYDPYSNVDLKTAVLVNASGEELKKDNYVPVTSLPVYEFKSTENVNWKNIENFPAEMDSLKQHVGIKETYTTSNLLKQLEDSLEMTFTPFYGFDEQIGNEYSGQIISFYRKKNLQLFSVPPPSSVDYRFEISDINKMKGGENIKVMRTVNKLEIDGLVINDTSVNWKAFDRFEINGKTAYSFGELRYFAYPFFDDIMDTTGTTEKLEELERKIGSQAVLEDLKRFNYFMPLVRSGIARPIPYPPYNYMTSGLDTNFHLLQFYEYTNNLGFAIENEVMVQPGYVAVALQPTNLEMPYVTHLFLVDSMLNVFHYNTLTRKYTTEKHNRFVALKPQGLISQNVNSRLYTIHNRGRCIYPYDFYYETSPTLTGIKRIIDKTNCNAFNLSNIYGEDSLVADDNGDVQYVYWEYCDTIVNGPYAVFQNTPGITWYEDENGKLYQFPRKPINNVHFSETVLQTYIPLNEVKYRSSFIREKENGLQLVNSNGNTLDITEKEYREVLKIRKGENGFGGIRKNGKFIPYQTLLPFPEQHKVYIHVSTNCWLIGKKGNLQLVELAPGGIQRRHETIFASYEDFRTLLFDETETEIKTSLWEFIGEWVE